MTIDQPGKEKIKYEPLEKEEKETFDEKLFVFETQHSVGRDGEPAASKQHPILRRQSNVAKSSMKNLIVKNQHKQLRGLPWEPFLLHLVVVLVGFSAMAGLGRPVGPLIPTNPD